MIVVLAALGRVGELMISDGYGDNGIVGEGGKGNDMVCYCCNIETVFYAQK